MGQFNISKQQEGDKLLLNFSGQIDEDANFAEADLAGAKEIRINLENVESINSCGIREWIKWIRSAAEGSRITYSQCPKVIVDQINMVAGFLPENAKVESFFVPYYCDESGTEKMVLFTEGQEFDEDGVKPPENITCDESGAEMEMDVIEAKYFKFLNN